MIKISKNEAKMLREANYGEFVKHTFSKHKTYYLVEEQEDVYRYNRYKRRNELVRLSALNKLAEIRKSVTKSKEK